MRNEPIGVGPAADSRHAQNMRSHNGQKRHAERQVEVGVGGPQNGCRNRFTVIHDDAGERTDARENAEPFDTRMKKNSVAATGKNCSDLRRSFVT